MLSCAAESSFDGYWISKPPQNSLTAPLEKAGMEPFKIRFINSRQSSTKIMTTEDGAVFSGVYFTPGQYREQVFWADGEYRSATDKDFGQLSIYGEDHTNSVKDEIRLVSEKRYGGVPWVGTTTWTVMKDDPKTLIYTFTVDNGDGAPATATRHLTKVAAMHMRAPRNAYTLDSFHGQAATIKDKIKQLSPFSYDSVSGESFDHVETDPENPDLTCATGSFASSGTCKSSQLLTNAPPNALAKKPNKRAMNDRFKPSKQRDLTLTWVDQYLANVSIDLKNGHGENKSWINDYLSKSKF